VAKGEGKCRRRGDRIPPQSGTVTCMNNAEEVQRSDGLYCNTHIPILKLKMKPTIKVYQIYKFYNIGKYCFF